MMSSASISNFPNRSITAWLFAQHRSPDDDSPKCSTEPVKRTCGQKVVGLLVEDNRADILLLEEAISLHGVDLELHIVTDGEKAFEFIERAERDPQAPCPQLLVVDLNLPKRSGQEVIERVRRSEKCKDIPILVTSSSNSPADRKEVARLGAQDYFCKPPNYDEFLKIGGVLKRIVEEHII